MHSTLFLSIREFALTIIIHYDLHLFIYFVIYLLLFFARTFVTVLSLHRWIRWNRFKNLTSPFHYVVNFTHVLIGQSFILQVIQQKSRPVTTQVLSFFVCINSL